MIDLSKFKHQKFAIFGLGKSGLSTAKALQKAGAIVYLWDDNEVSRVKATELGFKLVDLSELDFLNLDGLILSPGVPLTHPKPHWTVDKANAAKIPIIGDVELFLQAVKQVDDVTLIAVTGTNGKSTSVSLIYHILKNTGLDVHLGGNIGTTPVLNMPKAIANRVYIVELSSYQIDLMPSLQKKGFAPDVAVLINVSPDHIDRHGTIENYAKIKSQIFAIQENNKLAIYGIDDEFGAAFIKKSKTNKPVGISAIDKSASYYCKNAMVYQANKLLFNLQDARNLQGVHNAQNAAIAYEIAKYFNIDDDIISQNMLSFAGLAHRMEYVGKIELENGEVLFINDSKATNVEAVKSALGAFDNIYWLAGGVAKEGGLTSITNVLGKIEKAYLFGDSSQVFASDLIGVANFEVFSTMKAAINKALTEIVQASPDGQKVILL
ncbi:MAG: UDP-N-acetylmuramoyl-L-alanine--D-glutamate ligase, partial [Rhizobiales bacterium]|nr:UDP-N-acetylmuramoyl-L-alanine--D-glutamate ligase [Hyphomicrobiales bacterium]